MVDKGFELLVGARQDSGFGPITMVGIGGIFVELFADAAPGIGVLTRQDVARMLTKTRAGKVLDGFRGQVYDREAIIDLTICVSRLMAENPDISELDLNPVIVYENGYAIVDTRLIKDPDFTAPSRKRISDWKRKSLDAVFNAESVAVVGASRPGTQGGVILKNCMKIKNSIRFTPHLKPSTD